MSHKVGVQVGDVGTLYKARVVDGTENFDPSDATVKLLIFSTPSGDIVRTATVTTAGTDTKQKWYLTYTVVLNDVSEGLHLLPGVYQWQGYLEFADGQTYHTSVATYIVGSNLN